MFAAITMVAEAVTEAAHEAPKSGLPQLNIDTFTPQLFWLALTFVTLLFVMSKIALPRIAEVLDERKDRIARDLEAAETLKTDTDNALTDYEKALANARSSASGIAKEMRERIASETDAEKAKVDGQIAAKIADAEKLIVQSKTRALSTVNDIAADTARAVVNKLIGQDVSLDDVKKALPVSGK